MRIEFDVFGDLQLSRSLLRFSERAADMSPAFEGFADVVEAIERRQFASEGKASSGGWKPLRPGTIAAKQAAGLDTRILHRTLRLQRSLTRKSHPDHVRRIDPHEVFVGTKVPYARHHQRGRGDFMPAMRVTGRRRTRMPGGRGVPRRRPVELTQAQRRNLVRILQLYLVRGEVRRIGLRGGGQ